MPQGNEVAGVVAIDFRRSAASIEVRVEDAQSGKGHEIESIVQAEMIFGDAGHADLCQVTDRCEEGHAAE